MEEQESVDIPFPIRDYAESQDFMPSEENIAFKLKLIQVIHKLDQIVINEDLKNEIICFIDPILTCSSLTNLEPIQIREFLEEWKLKETTTKIDYPDSITPEFRKIMRNLRFQLKLLLNMAKRGWRGDHAFEVHTQARYDVRQRQEQIENLEKKKDIFRKRRKGEEE